MTNSIGGKERLIAPTLIVDSTMRSQLLKNPHYTCAVKRRWSTAGESPARELGSLHPEAIGATVEETKSSEPPV